MEHLGIYDISISYYMVPWFINHRGLIFLMRHPQDPRTAFLPLQDEIERIWRSLQRQHGNLGNRGIPW